MFVAGEFLPDRLVESKRGGGRDKDDIRIFAGDPIEMSRLENVGADENRKPHSAPFEKAVSGSGGNSAPPFVDGRIEFPELADSVAMFKDMTGIIEFSGVGFDGGSGNQNAAETV